MSMKNPLTPAGIEPSSFQFVGQHLNHCVTVVPTFFHGTLQFSGRYLQLLIIRLHMLVTVLQIVGMAVIAINQLI